MTLRERVHLLINTSKGVSVLSTVLAQYGATSIGGVCTYNDETTEDSSANEIEKTAVKNKLSLLKSRNSTKIKEHFLCLDANCQGIVLVIGWQYLLPNELIQMFVTVIFHDSLLPKYRGFCPTVSALIKGEPYIGATALFASEDMDAGDVIAQKKLPVTYPFKISEAFEAIGGAYSELVVEVLSQFDKGRIEGKEQNHNDATFCLWRGEDDYRIQWNQKANDIVRFIDALGPPYKGAKAYMDEKEIRIFDAVEVSEKLIEIRQPGKVLHFGMSGEPVIVCGQGLLQLNDIRMDGKHLNLKKLRVW
eukprot:CAMPEP_0113620092 /NCGR_PEP_ID=MMETSP0017_2-20120614/10225_1 /TAXON_ID=2856 /ORGANISM="Cylindrotheca closterium" /LENGTH=304 /DNA_ID=CAMNT_0000529723 /DNA_START=27 /DNA_END=938 /DNA_ORIENTATION=+ /assembly_acc=CAM_ASM_000147